MTKPKLLIMSDHSSLHTGFATVSRNIANYLFDTGKYEIKELGWFAPPKGFVDKEMTPKWQTYVTDRTTYEFHEKDKYGKYSLPKVLGEFQPHVLLTIGDEWMINHAGDWRDKWNYKWVSYVPIDGIPHPPDWSNTFAAADIMVAYCDWAVKAIKQRNPNIKPRYVWHGVDLKCFKPLTPAERQIVKQQLGFGNRFIVGCVARNQPRKQIPILFKAFAYLVHPKATCPVSGKKWICQPDLVYINEFLFPPSEIPFICETHKNHRISPFTGIAIQEENPEVILPNEIALYLHMALVDVGWDLMEQVGRYQLEDYVIKNDVLKIGKGVSTKDLGKIYNAMDVFALPTIGEGWGLPISEAMACGTPTIVTNYSAHVDFAYAGGPLINVKAFYTEPHTNIERALADPIDLANKIAELRDNPQKRERHSREGRIFAEKMDWQTKICPQWENIIDEALALQQADTRPYHQEKIFIPNKAPLEVT